MSYEKPNELTLDEVMKYLATLEAKWSAEGNIDSERDVLENIKSRLLSGAITPSEAKREADSTETTRIER